MQDKYVFFYDESEHSRSITKETISAENFANNFIIAIIGYKFNELQSIDFNYQKFEEQYKKFYSVSELKSTIIKKSKYKFGLKNLKNTDIRLINDLLSFVYSKNLEIYISVQNKIEYVINQMLDNYDNDFFVDADSMRYSVSKLINMYMPEKVIESIYLNDGTFIDVLTGFLKELLKLNSNNPNKINENLAIEQLIILLGSYDKKFIINWDYSISFEGFCLFLKERNIKNYSLLIDKEGNGNTAQAAISVLDVDVSEVDSKNCVGVRIADMVAGIISKLVVAIHDSLAYKDISDGKNLKFLDKEWFNIDEQRFNCYKLIKSVVIDLNDSWYKTYCTNYSDDFLYLIAILKYFDTFKDFADFKNIPIEDHPYRVNGGAIEMLKERFSIMASKLKIDPIDTDPKESDFFYNQRGAKCFFDFSKQEKLIISESGSKYKVLSVGFFGKMEKACITVEENGLSICYVIPDELKEWAFTCVSMANKGENLFPSYVVFSKKGNRYFADVE